MKKTLKVFMLLFILFSLVGCRGKIDTPTNVKITGNILSWDEVKDATAYVVKVSANEYNVTTTSFDLGTLTLGLGSYQVSVKATGDDNKESKYSSALTYEVGVEQLKLSAPTNLLITDGVLSWNQVTDAQGYVVTVNGHEIETGDLSVNITDFVASLQDYAVTVKAKGNGSTQFDSVDATVTLKFDQQLLTSKRVELCSIFIAIFGYEMGMEESDFDYEYQYTNYLSIVETVEMLADALIDSKIVANSVKSLMFIIDEVSTYQDPFLIIKTMAQNLDSVGITAEQLAAFSVILGNATLDMAVESLENQIQISEDDVLDYRNTYLSYLEHYEGLITELDNLKLDADETLLTFFDLLDEYKTIIFNGYAIIDPADIINDNYPDCFGNLVRTIEDIQIIQYNLDLEIAKGEEADQQTIDAHETKIEKLNDDKDMYLEMFGIYYDAMAIAADTIGEKFEQVFLYRKSHEEDSVIAAHTFYNNLILAQYDCVDSLREYDKAFDRSEEQKAYLNEQLGQLSYIDSVLGHENIEKLMKMSFEQMYLFVDEINWDIIEAFILTLDDTEPPTSTFLAQVIAEAARLLRVANDFDYATFVDLSLEMILPLFPDITEDQQQMIRSLHATTVPAINNLFITIIENIDEEVIDQFFLLVEIDPLDFNKVDPKTLVELNPDFIIVGASIYNDVFAEALLSLIGELEEVYQNIAVFYPGFPVIDFEELTTKVTTINQNMVTIAEYQIITEGYYPNDLIIKIQETLTLFEELYDLYSSLGQEPIPDDYL